MPRPSTPGPRRTPRRSRPSTGSASAPKRPSPGGGPTKTTSCLVTRTRSPATSGKRRGSHGPAANTNSPAADARTVGGHDRVEAAPSAPPRGRPGELEATTFGLEPPGDRGHAPSGHQQPGLGLEDGERQVVRGELRPAPHQRLRREPLDRDAETRGASTRMPPRIRRRSGRTTARRPERRAIADRLAERDPGVPSLARPARVERVRAVRGADDPRLVAGRRPRMTRPVRIDQRRPPAAPSSLERRPGAHHAGPDDDDVAGPARSRAGHGVRVRVDTAAAAIASGVNGSATVRPLDQASIWSL